MGDFLKASSEFLWFWLFFLEACLVILGTGAFVFACAWAGRYIYVRWFK